MTDLKKLVDGLVDKDNKQAYECLKLLEQASLKSAEVYPFFDQFVDMLDDSNSYIRTRGIILIAANAKWDIDFKLDEIIDLLLRHIADDKPIMARQCIKILPSVVKYKPDLKADIEKALNLASPSRYKDSMQSLVSKDIQQALQEIQRL